MFTSQCQSGLNVPGVELHPWWLCVSCGRSVGCSSYIKGQKWRTVSTGLTPGLNGQDEWRSPLVGCSVCVCVCASGLKEELCVCVCTTWGPAARQDTAIRLGVDCSDTERLYPVSGKMRTHSDGPQVKTTDWLITRTAPLGHSHTQILGFPRMKKTLSVPTRLWFTLHRT